jgi:cytochrome c-type biogenesis protein CcmH/NrfG
MNQDELSTKVGEAWKAHYGGDNAVAIETFQQVVEQAPDHIDAHWGLGLSYRKAGDKENALRAFERVQELVTVELDKEPEDYERFFMLRRMVQQQIAQMNEFLD